MKTLYIKVNNPKSCDHLFIIPVLRE